MGVKNAARRLFSSVVIWICLLNEVAGDLCKEYGHSCTMPSKCCGSKCCTDQDYDSSLITYYRWNLWNMWYFWFIIVFILMSCFGGCGYYKRRQMLFSRNHLSNPISAPPPRRTRRTNEVPVNVAVPIFPSPYAYTGPGSDHQGAYITAPPPYSEVVSHPSLYPVHKTELPPYPGDGNALYTTGSHLNRHDTSGVPMMYTNRGDYPQNIADYPSHQTMPPLPPYSTVISGSHPAPYNPDVAATASRSNPTNPGPALPSDSACTPPSTMPTSIPRESA